jgi:hypothetical protein
MGERVEEFQTEQELLLDKPLLPKARKRQTQEVRHSGQAPIPEQVPGGSNGNKDSVHRPLHYDNPSRLQLSWRIPAERARRKQLPIRELFYGLSLEAIQFITDRIVP